MIKIIEGTAKGIETEGNKLTDYDLDSLQFAHRSCIYINANQVSDREYSFYVAVFKRKENHD